MAAVDVVLGTPLADELQNAVQPKLVEMGWSTGGLDDSALSEYIVLMLVNGKTQDQIAAELSQDLLGLSADDTSAVGFAQWLFQQVETFSGQPGADIDGMETETSTQGLAAQVSTSGGNNVQAGSDDTAMGDETVNPANSSAIPTGPKSMRDGPRASGTGRMLGQLNKAMDRAPDVALHRIKGTAGTGRINSHVHNPPKGPTPKGPRNHINRALPAAQPKVIQTPQNLQNMPMAPMMPNPFTAMTPQQQMQIFKIYEEQARLMAQAMAPHQQQQMMQSFQTGNMQPTYPVQSPQAGKSLFERVEAPAKKSNGNYSNPQSSNGRVAMNPDVAPFTSSQISNKAIDPVSSMEVESSSQSTTKPDPSTTVCYFNLSCTKPDCYFVHQSPAAPPGTTIDMTDTCSFGAACKNRKCVGKHPSPSSLAPQRAQQDCKFYPNCTNPHCPFRHPTTIPCHNGADCAVPDCKYSHNKTICRYNPCLNPACLFKHVSGQKRGNFDDKVWINKEEGGEEGGGGQREHVSERKFVEDDAEEELIRPGEIAEEAHRAEIIA